jgi:hypothetical protein
MFLRNTLFASVIALLATPNLSRCDFLWVANSSGFPLAKYDPATGQLLSELPLFGSSIAFDSSGDLWVVNSTGFPLSEYNPATGQLLGELPLFGDSIAFQFSTGTTILAVPELPVWAYLASATISLGIARQARRKKLAGGYTRRDRSDSAGWTGGY